MGAACLNPVDDAAFSVTPPFHAHFRAADYATGNWPGVDCSSGFGSALAEHGCPGYDQNGRANDTLVIFDWDDTLLCSTAINKKSWSQSELTQLEEIVALILVMAMRLGETMIVTNGNEQWVQKSTRHFLPRLETLLDRLEVVSARAKYEADFPMQPMMWKRWAFMDILGRRAASQHSSLMCGLQSQTNDTRPAVGVNLIVLGDSVAEIEAARDAPEALGVPCIVKTVKFKETPSVSELLGQLRRVAEELPRLALAIRSANTTLVSTNPTNLEGAGYPWLPRSDVVSGAANWRIAELAY